MTGLERTLLPQSQMLPEYVIPLQTTRQTHTSTEQDVCRVWRSYTDYDTVATFCKARCFEDMEIPYKSRHPVRSQMLQEY
jgi:hypothetical protein